MQTRKKLRDVLYDFADYIQVFNNRWDGHHTSFDMMIMFTGQYEFEDGDG